MSISKFEQLEQLATTDYFAARCLGDVLSGGIPMKGVSIDYTRALQCYVLSDFLTPKKIQSMTITIMSRLSPTNRKIQSTLGSYENAY